MIFPLIFAASIYGIIVVGGMTWMIWHANRRANQIEHRRRMFRDAVMVRLLMEGKRQ